MEGALNNFLFGASLFLVFQAITKSLMYFKFKPVPNQDMFHAHSIMKDCDSGIC